MFNFIYSGSKNIVIDYDCIEKRQKPSDTAEQSELTRRAGGSKVSGLKAMGGIGDLIAHGKTPDWSMAETLANLKLLLGRPCQGQTFCASGSFQRAKRPG